MNRRQLMILPGAALAMRRSAAGAEGAEGQTSADPMQVSPDKLLLKDYRPKSIYRVPQTEVKKAKYPAIDAHVHAVRTQEEVDRQVREMDEANVEKSIIFAGASTPERFALVSKMYSKYPKRFDMWCGFDLTGVDEPGFGPNALKSLEECHKLGAVGVGEISDKGRGLGGRRGSKASFGPHPDDPRMDALFDRCAKLAMPINIHVSDPIWSYQPMDNTNDGLMNCYTWTIKMEPGMYGHDELIESLEKCVKKHPKTIFVACHLANLEYDLARLGGILDRNSNLYIDLGARFAETSPIARSVNLFFQKYPDRTLYGTDMALNQPMFRATFRIMETLDEHFYVWDEEVQKTTGSFAYHWPLYGFGLSDALLKKIYRDNTLKVIKRAKDNAA